ncbi:MAG: FAD-dependent oxidoreductase [Kofleriaceae bacterium]|nr:FAD-dependent oxidoreductase [Kofleriaceae bacterium]
MRTFAVIGAGIAGIACARELATIGRVTVFDKGRGFGGRLANRRTEHARFDHGAQYLTARSAAFRAVVDGWCATGVAAPWRGRIVSLDGATLTPVVDEARFVGVPGMSAVVRALAGDLDVRHGVRVGSLAQVGRRWRLRDDAEGVLGEYDAVVVAVPAAQAVPLLPLAALAERAATVRMRPCWAAMVGFARSVDAAFDGAFVSAGALSWIAREASKPGRDENEAWTVHASPAWSTTHLEEERVEVADALARELVALLGASPPVFVDAHRWRYALVEAPVGEPCLVDADAGLAACGDWCLGARVELAYESGRAAAAALAG